MMDVGTILGDLKNPDRKCENLLLQIFPVSDWIEVVGGIVIGDDGGNQLIWRGSGIFNSPDERFINSSLKDLFDFLDIFESSCTGNGIEDEAHMRQRMQSDARAFSSEENWWPIILEQVEEELL